MAHLAKQSDQVIQLDKRGRVDRSDHVWEEARGHILRFNAGLRLPRRFHVDIAMNGDPASGSELVVTVTEDCP